MGSPSFGVIGQRPHPGRDESGPYAPLVITPKDGEPKRDWVLSKAKSGGRIPQVASTGLSGAEDPCGRRWIQPFRQRSQHHGNLVGGGFQPVQGRVASSTEGGAAGLTAKRLDAFGLAMLAIAQKPHESAHRRSQSTGTAGSDRRSPRCRCVWGRTGGFSPQTRGAPAQALVLHPTRLLSRVDRRDNRLGSGA